MFDRVLILAFCPQVELLILQGNLITSWLSEVNCPGDIWDYLRSPKDMQMLDKRGGWIGGSVR